MRTNLIKRFLATAATMATLGAAVPSMAKPTASPQKATQTASVDAHAQDRADFLKNYTDLNLDFEGDFPAIYWDHGNIAGPGGVKLDKTKTITVRKITSLNGSRIPVISYKAKEKAAMASMAEGVLPPAYKKQFKIELVQLKVGTLNKSNIPNYGETSFTNTVYYVPSNQRKTMHEDAIEAHLKIAEDLFGADRFYQLPLARQIAIVDMIYPLHNKFATTKFGKAVLASDWMGMNADEPHLTNQQVAMREAWASLDEKDHRRHLLRKFLLQQGTSSLLPANVPSVEEIAKSLPAGETKLAMHAHNILSATATNNQQRIIFEKALQKRGLEK